MNVEREIAGVAIPFTSGVLISFYAESLFCNVSSIILIAAGLACSTLLLRDRLELNQEVRYITIIIVACTCGIITGLTGSELSINLPDSPLKRLSTLIGGKLQGAIEALPLESPDHKSLITALLTGERSSLPHHIIESFQNSGASHILALSGLHLGIIYGIISKTLSIMGNSIAAKRVRSIIIICICGLYTTATGAGPSIVRAFIFIIIGEAVRLSCRYHSLSQTFFISLIIQLVVCPMATQSISFQLSYAAMAGIVFIYPWLSKLWPKEETTSGAGRIFEKAIKWIWDCASLSISCQLTTAPLAYIYFGTFPTYFILTNLIALPLTGVLIPTALLTLCVSCIANCPPLLIKTTSCLIDLLLDSMEIIGSM